MWSIEWTQLFQKLKLLYSENKWMDIYMSRMPSHEVLWHWLLINMETIDIKSVKGNIDFTRVMLSKLHSFVKNWCGIIKK